MQQNPDKKPECSRITSTTGLASDSDNLVPPDESKLYLLPAANLHSSV